MYTLNSFGHQSVGFAAVNCGRTPIKPRLVGRISLSAPYVRPVAGEALSGRLERANAQRCKAVRADSATDVLDSASVQLIANITKEVDQKVANFVQESSAAAKQPGSKPTSVVRAKLEGSIRKIETGLLEREQEVRLMLLAALCGEHLLLLGPPGTAKSELARRLTTLCHGKYFERLLTRFSVPEELFGPLSMRGLENDQYVRQTDGYLPTAEVAFIDEIFKANSAILNALLTILNERLFDNGNQRLKVPLLSLVGASNELPESEELDALYDRFLIRKSVAQVSNGQLHKLAKLAAGRGSDSHKATVEAGVELSMDDFRHTCDAAYDAVDVPDSVIDILTNVRNYLQDKCEPPIYVSDRRFMKSVQMLQVVAYADGRNEVNEYDCLLLEHVFGNRPDDSAKVRSYVLEVIASDPGLQQTELVFLGLFGQCCRLLEANGSNRDDAILEASSLVELLEGRQRSLAITLEGDFQELRTTVWQSEGSVQSAVQALVPQMTENKRKVEDLLREARTLLVCVTQGTAASVLERLLPKRYKQFQKGISGKV